MFSLLEFSDILDYIFCNYVGIKKMPIESLRNKKVIMDSFQFSKKIKKSTLKKGFENDKFCILGQHAKDTEVIYEGKYFASKKKDFECLYKLEQIRLKCNFFEKMRKYIIQKKLPQSQKETMKNLLNCNCLHIQQYYNQQNYLQTRAKKYNFKNKRSPKNSLGQISYLMFKNSDSIIYGLPYHFCSVIEIRQIIRSNNEKYYYYYDLQQLASMMQLSLKKMQVLLFQTMIIYTCQKKKSQNFLIFRIFDQHKQQFCDIYNNQIKKAAEKIIDILLFLKKLILNNKIKNKQKWICQEYKIPLAMFLKTQNKYLKQVVYDEEIQKVLNFDFQSKKFSEYQNDSFKELGFFLSYNCFLPGSFAYLLNTKKDTVTFQSLQFLMANFMSKNFFEQNFKSINLNLQKKLMMLIFKNVPKLIVFKQFLLINYYRFVDKVNNFPLDISILQKDILSQEAEKMNQKQKLQEQFFLQRSDNLSKKVLIDFCFDIDIFETEHQYKNELILNDLNTMLKFGLAIEEIILILYCLKSDVFSVKNFISRQNFYDTKNNSNKNTSLDMIDDNLLFEYKSELFSQDYCNLFFEQYQERHQKLEQTQQKQNVFQKLNRQDSNFQNQRQNIKDFNMSEQECFSTQNVLWFFETKNTLLNKFQNFENINLIMQNILLNTNQLLKQEDELIWDDLVDPVISLHKTINFGCFLYLIISKPDNLKNCNDILIQRQGCFLNWIKNKFNSVIRVNMLYNCLSDQTNNISQNMEQLQLKVDNHASIAKLFSKSCSSESTAILKELLVLLAIRQNITKRFQYLDIYFLTKVEKLKKQLGKRNVSFNRYFSFLKNLQQCFQQCQTFQIYASYKENIDDILTLVQTI